MLDIDGIDDDNDDNNDHCTDRNSSKIIKGNENNNLMRFAHKLIN